MTSAATKKKIESRLRLYLGNLCMAVLSKREGDLATTKQMLLDEIDKLIEEAKAGKL